MVLALDQYDHGHSDLNNEVYEQYSAFGTAFLKAWAPFWINSMHDAVAYMYEQPYVLKDEAGNGIIGVASLLIELPFFNKAKTELKPLPSVEGTSAKFGTFALLLCLIMLPGIFFTPLMDGSAGSDMVNILLYAGCAFAIAGFVGFIYSLIGKQNRKPLLIGSCFVMVAGVGLALIAYYPMYQDNTYWSALGIKSIAYWTLGCAVMSLLAMSVVYVANKVNNASRSGITASR